MNENTQPPPDVPEFTGADPVSVAEVLPDVLRVITVAQEARGPRIRPEIAKTVIEEARSALEDPGSDSGAREAARRRIRDAQESQGIITEGT